MSDVIRKDIDMTVFEKIEAQQKGYENTSAWMGGMPSELHQYILVHPSAALQSLRCLQRGSGLR